MVTTGCVVARRTHQRNGGEGVPDSGGVREGEGGAAKRETEQKKIGGASAGGGAIDGEASARCVAEGGVVGGDCRREKASDGGVRRKEERRRARALDVAKASGRRRASVPGARSMPAGQRAEAGRRGSTRLMKQRRKSAVWARDAGAPFRCRWFHRRTRVFVGGWGCAAEKLGGLP